MSKTLEVIEPYFTLSVGDTLELTKDGKYYEISRKDEFSKVGKNGEDYTSSYSSTYLISVEMAKELINEGFLAEGTANTTFVNVFDEIDNLLDKYTKELNNIDKDMKGCQECVKLEKFTVLSNMIKLLSHLKGLKK